VVSVIATGLLGRGLKPGRDDGFLRAGSKAGVLMS
jgi:hypothetical protein